MDDYRSLAHTKWKCKYHIVFIPKYRRKVLYGNLRTYLGQVFHELARHTESTIEEGVLCPDHVHMLIWIPLKFAVERSVTPFGGSNIYRLGRFTVSSLRFYRRS